MIETLDDIVEELADKFGIYGAGPENDDHPDDCKCRICYTSWMNTRIRRAIEVEERLEYATERVDYCPHCQQERPMMLSIYPGENSVATEIHCAFCGRYVNTDWRLK